MITHADLPNELNLATWFVDRNVEEGRGDRTALIDANGPVTYAELARIVNRSGNLLRELGVRAEDRVLLALGDSVEFVALWYGAQKIGAVTAEAYTFLQPKDYAYYLDYTDAAIVVADETTETAIRQVAGERQVLVVDEEFHARFADLPDELEPAPTTKDDVALWKFTTGSTGQPKGAVHPVHSPVLSNDWYAQGVLGIREDDLVLSVPKLFFGYARDLTALYPFGVGGAGIVFPERTTPERIFELVAEHRPTILVNVPTMMAQMVNHPDAASQDLSCLRLCTSAGEALPRELHDRWLDTFGVEVLDGIGSSELYHIYISNRPGRARPGSTGELVPGYEAELDENGELLVTGDTAALLYWDDDEKTKHTFNGDTVRTGDLFERDEDGFFWYRGRVDDLIKVGGIWVAPAEIEHCLVGHPDVVECAVVGAAQNGLMVPRAYVVARKPVEERRPAELRPRAALAAQVPARGALRRRPAEDSVRQDRPQGADVSRVVVVTGGKKGIGKAVAERFAAEGDRVEAVGRDELDVTDEAQVTAFFERLGRVDVLVNNAGVASGAPLARTTLDDWRAHFDVNATGAFLCTRAVIGGMIERGDGRIVTVASTAGLAGARYTAAYAASKHAAVGLMRATAAEVAGTGVTANAVCPAYVRTDMTRRTVEHIVANTARTAAEAESELAAMTPLGRLLEPDEVAAAVVFLASPEAATINGQTLVLDGGGLQT